MRTAVRDRTLNGLTAFWSLLLLIATVATGTIRAADVESENSSNDEQKSSETYSAEERNLWSLQPIKPVRVPMFNSDQQQDWIQSPIDAFVLRRLNDAGLSPSKRADQRTLIRRLYLQMTGLPPGPDAIEEFRRDDRPDAWLRLVDRVIASPQYGEKWGQHWLDVVRFAESEGFEYDRHHKAAWRFRDYVIDSLNEDKPFDQFATEQIAGDELAASLSETDPRSNDRLRNLLIASGFHRLGPVRRNAGNPEIAFSRNEVLTEMTNAVGTVFLGLTVGCARCHDHFYDPFRQKDYYRLQAFMASTHEFDAPFVDEHTWSVWKAETERINSQIYKLKNHLSNAPPSEKDGIRKQIAELQKNLPKAVPMLFSVKSDAARRTQVHLLKRGDETKPLEPVGMRVPGVLLADKAPERPAGTPQSKMLLANWVTDSGNPLTARVIVNRVWQYHFGRGIVATTNDLGVNGERPTHPELLDLLATRFVEDGWSLKSLHRLILTSSAWQQASDDAKWHMLAKTAPDTTNPLTVDPENMLLWKFSRRRMTAEEIRDSILKVSGLLNPGMHGESVMVPVEQQLIDLLYKPAQWQVTENRFQHNRRSVYLIAKRNLRVPFLEVFDQPDLQTSCDRRESSTHAPQALELMNGKTINRAADALAQRLQDEFGSSPDLLIDRAFLLATSRSPSAQQREAVRQFLIEQPLRELALAVMNMNAFVYVE